jgi:Ca-activated chloride channel family protein
VDLRALEQIAQTTGGRSFRGEQRQGLEGIYKTLDEITPEKVKRSLYRPKRALYFYPLCAAALLLIAYHAGMLARVTFVHKSEIRSTNIETRNAKIDIQDKEATSVNAR